MSQKINEQEIQRTEIDNGRDAEDEDWEHVANSTREFLSMLNDDMIDDHNFWYRVKEQE